ncbi:hypothetical protein NDA10_005197 [Ustilago hordei]|uniref:Tyrosinase copper-binding domain-containing protein n=1 Tax=Ustilago hordei TaxID=120017 RepID=I2FTP4_USTHO|nr:uncharacterized protein UHO2_06216 [Ustilago hordei]KAJ1037779.1 hypothetical protein NDA10_005197 [Ustilago hordei]CCF50287.1 uncharacterized protein UHOR_07876 [Ustilago hordei]SYW86999.1 uncharacterized protein UHO2_06216 [Ustilago hordei]
MKFLITTLSTTLLFTSLSLVSAADDHNPFPPSTTSPGPSSNVDALLHCLGKGPSSRADRDQITSLLNTHSHPSNLVDEGLLTQLPPRSWGFTAHDAPQSNTWFLPTTGDVKLREKTERQRQKLLGCVKKVYAANENGGESRVLPDMWGGSGFRMIKQGQGWNGGEGMMRPSMAERVVAKNSPESVTPARDAISGGGGALGGRSGNGDPGAQKAGDEQNLAASSDPSKTVPGRDGKPVDDRLSTQALTTDRQKAPTTADPTTDGDKLLSTDPKATSADVKATKLPPGLSQDSFSVAPELINDPQQKMMPQPGTNPGLTEPTLSLSNTNSTNPATTDPATMDPATTEKLQLTSPNPNLTSDTNRRSTCKSFLIRKEYSTLTLAEKTAYASALKCVQTKPSRFRSDSNFNAADDWTLLHVRMVKYVHFTAYFTVFHRAFTALVEQDLVACGLPAGMGLPWVDWTKTSDDPSTNALFDSDPRYGLGTDGSGDSDDCAWGRGKAVTDGALSDHWFNAPFRHRLCRQFNNLDTTQPNPHFGSNCSTFLNANFLSGLGKTHGKGRFFDFSAALEISTHLAMHTCVGGNMAWLSTSPNEYVFHSHHGFIDNVFSTWQNKTPENRVAFHGPKQQQKEGMGRKPWDAKKEDVINFQPLAENIAAGELLDHESGKWGGRLCYRYDYAIPM